jgi:phosphatidylserine decarboxylase
MGFIKFGSRVDVFVPLGTEINVEIGQKVKAAESLLGVLK